MFRPFVNPMADVSEEGSKTKYGDYIVREDSVC